MKEFSLKITSFLVALVVLFSTMSFTIDMHYCGDTLVDTAVFQKATTCGMDISKSKSTSECSIVKKICCHDKQIIVDGQSEMQLALDKVSFEQQLFIISFVDSYINLFESSDKDVSFYSQYRPSLVTKQLYKLDESYLI